MNNDLTYLKDLQTFCLNKYQYIIEKEHAESLSIEEIMDLIVVYYEDIIGCMPGNVYWFDKNVIAVGCNKNVLNMFGLKSSNEFKGLTFEAMGKIGKWSEEATQSFKQDTLEVLLSGEACLNVEEPPIPHSDGRLIYFLSNRVPIFDRKNNVIGVVGISIDITERKEMEISLLEAKEAAEVANHTKTIFMENMSHDFKTPLNGIYGVVQLLKDREDLPEDIKELVDAQYKSIVRLNKLVNSILDFNRISSGKITLQEEELNLFDILDSIAHNLSYQTKDKNVKLNIHYPPSIPHYLISDSYAVTSILMNLLSNAVKFTDKGEVSVSINCLSQESQNILFQIMVSDTGSGIPGDKLGQIFERFHRLEPSNKGLKEGHGIGLSVVKELVEKLNGKIEVSSEIGKGSVFTLKLPFKLSDRFSSKINYD
jgi:two-component system aerobic respiration control sensor histidine kinase ArcB